MHSKVLWYTVFQLITRIISVTWSATASTDIRAVKDGVMKDGAVGIIAARTRARRNPPHIGVHTRVPAKVTRGHTVTTDTGARVPRKGNAELTGAEIKD